METRTLDLLANNIDIDFFGVRIAEIDVPSGYVSYAWNPLLGDHEVVTGDKLINGLIVILADSHFRTNPERIDPAKTANITSYDRAQVQETSRWAVVTDLKNEGQLTKFNALYADGTVIPRTLNKTIPWAVAKEMSITAVCPACGGTHGSEKTTSKIARTTPEEVLHEKIVTSANEFLETIGRVLFGDLIAADENGYDRDLGYSMHPTDLQEDDEWRSRQNDDDNVFDEPGDNVDQDEAALQALREKLSGDDEEEEIERSFTAFDKMLFNAEYQAKRENAVSYSQKDAEMTMGLHNALTQIRVSAADLTIDDRISIGQEPHTVVGLEKLANDDILVYIQLDDEPHTKLIVSPDKKFNIRRYRSLTK